MTETVKAIYTNGTFRPLEPVHYREGEQVEIAIFSDEERIDAALSDLLLPRDNHKITEEEQRLLDTFKPLDLGVSVSDVIIEERREGP